MGDVVARRQAGVLNAPCDDAAHLWHEREEGGIILLDCGNEHRTIQVFVASLAGRFRCEQTGVASSAMECQTIPVGVMLSTEWIRGAQSHRFQRLVEMLPQGLRLSQADQSP
jgi:hypothetical protein